MDATSYPAGWKAGGWLFKIKQSSRTKYYDDG
jgi:hypothetical protein